MRENANIDQKTKIENPPLKEDFLSLSSKTEK